MKSRSRRKLASNPPELAASVPNGNLAGSCLHLGFRAEIATKMDTMFANALRDARTTGNRATTMDGYVYVILTIFSYSVVKPFMRAHFEAILPHDLPKRVADDASFRPPPEGMTFGVRVTSYELAQSYLSAARKDNYINKTTGATVKLDATFRKSDEGRPHGLALHLAYLALVCHGRPRAQRVHRPRPQQVAMPTGRLPAAGALHLVNCFVRAVLASPSPEPVAPPEFALPEGLWHIADLRHLPTTHRWDGTFPPTPTTTTGVEPAVYPLGYATHAALVRRHRHDRPPHWP